MIRMGIPGDTFPITMYTRIAGVNVTDPGSGPRAMDTPDMMDSWMDIQDATEAACTP